MDERGDSLIQQLPNLVILNNHSTPTRKPYNIATNPTSPDLSLASPDVALRATWEAVQELASDHVPLIIRHALHRPLSPPARRTYTNYKRADWYAFTEGVEADLVTFGLDGFGSLDEVT